MMRRNRTANEAPRLVLCQYCNRPAELQNQDDKSLYGGRNFGPIWVCKPCQAWVGCHPRTTIPLGTLADKQLRAARIAAHAAFDPVWQRRQVLKKTTKNESRDAAYKWLAQRLGINESRCHIALFDLETCAQVIVICEPYNRIGI